MVGQTVLVDQAPCVIRQADVEDGQNDYLCEPIDPTVMVRGQWDLGAGWVYERNIQATGESNE
jgi:hypothetical protein